MPGSDPQLAGRHLFQPVEMASRVPGSDPLNWPADTCFNRLKWPAGCWFGPTELAGRHLFQPVEMASGVLVRTHRTGRPAPVSTG
jgi:hypothetical protein